jgi:PAS domain S-box-containing protein
MVHLLFVILAAAVVATLSGELALMRASSIEQFVRVLQWRHVSIFVTFVAIVGFVRLYFDTGRWWLGIAACTVRFACLAINSASPAGLNFREITALRPVPLLDDTVTAPVGVVSPWSHLSELSALLLLSFVVDASISLWRRGNPVDRRRTVIVGGATALFIVVATGMGGMIHLKSVQGLPYFVSLPFVAIVAAMAYELSYDVLGAAALARRLHESEERMSLAATAAGLIVWTWDIQRDNILLSAKDRALLGFSPSEKLNSQRIRGVVHPEDRESVRQLVEHSLTTAEEMEAQYRIMLADGSVRWVTRRGRVEFGGDGKPAWERGVLMDITDRKQAEEKFRLAVEASPSGIVLINREGKILLVNTQTEKLFGYRRGELIGKLVEMLVPERFASQHPAYRAKFVVAPETRAMGAGRELFARRKDGSEFPVEIGLNPIRTPQGPLVLANVVDISARIAGEEEAHRRREQVELLSRVSLLGEMTASLAHELNQPLAAIMNNATAGMEYIKQGKLEQLQEILTDVIGDGRRAYHIMRNVRSAIKKGSAIQGRINLNDVVKAVTHMVHPDAAASFCKVEMSLARDLPAIEGDPIQIQQLLINLVRNAFDAMRDTTPSRRIVEIATNSNSDGTISVTVRDYGSGISEKTPERLFEQFFTTKEEGLGMGLAIVRSIVEAHGGTIAAENADGGGARFHFRLPAKEGTPQ